MLFVRGQEPFFSVPGKLSSGDLEFPFGQLLFLFSVNRCFIQMCIPIFFGDVEDMLTVRMPGNAAYIVPTDPGFIMDMLDDRSFSALGV